MGGSIESRVVHEFGQTTAFDEIHHVLLHAVIDAVASGRKFKMPGFPVRFSRTGAEIRRLQPKLGEHSVEILREAGLTEAEIEKLLDDRATRDGQGAKSQGAKSQGAKRE